MPVSLVAIAAVVVTAVAVIATNHHTPTGTLGDDPAAAFADADAVDFTYTYTASDGTQSTGQFTVTADGYATGTVTDTTAGAATVHATPGGSAVWGDEDWWARRVPSLASHAADQWVQADDGTALPIDPAAEFTPAGLADLVRNIDDRGTINPEITTYHGTPAAATTWEGWTLIRTATLPAETLALTGPIDQGLFHTAAMPNTAGEAAPASWDGTAPAPHHPQAGSSAGTVLLEGPEPAPPGAAAATAETTMRTLNGTGGDPASTAPPRGEADIALPSDIASFIKPLPAFTGTINANTCSKPTCEWSATVQNTGDGPGEVSATVSATPGMGTQTISLGTIQPGSSASTGTLSFANPAPKPNPGQTTSVTVTYSLVIYSPQIAGPNAPRYRELVDRLGGYPIQPLLDQVMQQLDTGLKEPAVEAMHSMLDDDVPPEEALTAIDEAAQADPVRGEYSEMPLVRRLSDAGARFTSWPQIAPMLSGFTPAEVTPYLPGIDIAVQELANPAEPTVALTFPVPAGNTGEQGAVVEATYPSPEETSKCISVMPVAGDDLAAAVTQAIANADEQSPDCTVSVRLTVPDTASAMPTEGLSDLEQRLQPSAEALCGGDSSGIDSVSISNAVGSFEWPLSSLCIITAPLTKQQQIEHLNSLDLHKDVITELAKSKLVTVDADNQIVDILWRDPEKDCTALPANGGAPFETTSTPGGHYENGPKAIFSSAYLCGKLTGGTSADKTLILWDWPTSTNPLYSSGGYYTFARCHLVGKQLGGSGFDAANLVTCYRDTNQDMSVGIEGPVKKQVDSGEHVFYLSVPQFNGRGEELSGIRVLAIGNKGYFKDVCFQNKFMNAWVKLGGPC